MSYLEKHPLYMLTVGIIGLSLSAIIVKYSPAPSLVTALYRLLFTVLLMSPVILGSRSLRSELLAVGLRTILLCAVSGVCLAVHFVTWFEALRYTSVASSTVIVCTESIWVALGCLLFLRERLKKKAFVGIAIAFAGSFLIAMADYDAGANQLMGDFLALLAAVMVACYTLLGRAVRRTTSTMVYTYIVYLFCFLSILVTAVLTGTPILGYPASVPAAGLGLAICSTLLGHSLLSWCLKYLSAPFVATAKLCEPVVASLIAMALFGEIPTAMQILGGIIILAGVIYYSRVDAR